MPQVRELASASVEYCKSKGGRVSANASGDLVEKLSRIGTCGKHVQNCERDLQFAVRTFAKTMECKILHVQCRLWDPTLNEVVHSTLPFIDPVSLASSLWRRGKGIFRRFFFGQLTEQEVFQYWDNASLRCEWFQKHEASSWDRSCWPKLCPISLYGDDVNNYRNTEAGNISILTFCSDLAHGNSPYLRYLLLTLYSEYTACASTYDDVMATLWHFAIIYHMLMCVFSAPKYVYTYIILQYMYIYIYRERYIYT